MGDRTSRIVMGTSVLTPTFRYNPAIIAQAFATLGCLSPERVIVGLGTGEALNEVAVTGAQWPAFKERFARTREAVHLMRQLWTEDRVSFASFCTSGKGMDPYTGKLMPAVAEVDPAPLFADLGATVIPEVGTGGLNNAIRYGLRYVGDAHPLRYRAVLMSDVPALAAADLDAALRLASRYRMAVVPDAAGTGTVMLTAGPGATPDPHFGAGSHARHRAAGMKTLIMDSAVTPRRDMDTPADLAAALALGVGPHTRSVLDALRILQMAS